MKPSREQLSFVVGSDATQAALAHSENETWRTERERVLKDLSDKPFVSPRVLASVVRMLEGLMVAFVALANLYRYPGIEQLSQTWVYTVMVLVAAVGFPVLLHISGGYRLNTLLRPMTWIPTLVACWTLVFAGLMLLTFLAKLGGDVSRNWLISWAISGLLFAFAYRFFLTHIVRRFNRNGQLNRRAVLVGGGPSADHVIATLNASQDTGMTVVGVFDDRSEERAPIKADNLRKLGTVDDLIDFVRSTRIDTLILTLPVTAENRLLQILGRLWVLPVDIRLSAHEQRLRFRPRAYSYVGNLPLLDLFDRPLGEWGPILKTLEDRVIASFALLLLAPVFAMVALAVKLESKGPVIFKQKRYGFNNELIQVYKFRSMYVDQADQSARKLVTRDDPRVTRVGRMIRKTSLDELPQLMNVLKGELSLVGPRPHATMASAAGSLYENVVDGYFARHRVKPGITGWAQINGWRGETDTAEKLERRVECDLYYIENWSLTFDLYILARTPLSLLNTKSAY